MVKSGSLVKVEYTAFVDGELAEAPGPLVVAVGKSHVLKGLDEALQATDVGVQSEVVVPPEKAYGERNPELVRLVPMEVFRRQGVEPEPGMVVELDNLPCKVQSVSGGRVRVDFNHELAGKTITYEFKIVEELSTPLAKVSAIAQQHLGDSTKCDFDNASKTAVINVDNAVCMKDGYLTSKARALSMLLTFVDEVEKVSVIEEYKRQSNV